MANKIRVLIGIVIIIAVAYWAFNAVRTRTYSGARLNVEVGDGQITVVNRGSEAVPVQMRTQGRTSTFRVESIELDLRESSSRMGAGREAYQGLAFDIPPGEATINVLRGNSVKFTALSNQPLEAVVNPKSPEGARGTLTFAGVVILGALYFISRTLEHRWLKQLISRIPRGKKGAPVT